MTSTELRTIYLGILSALLAMLIYRAIMLLDHLDNALDSTAADIHQIASDTHLTQLKLQSIIGSAQWPMQNAFAQVAAVAKVASQIEAMERSKFNAQSQILEDTDASIRLFNLVTIPRIDAILADADGAVSQARDLAGQVARDSGKTLSSADAAIDSIAADAQQARPGIVELSDSAAHLNGVSASMEASANDVQQFIHRELTPVRGTWNLVKKFLQGIAGPAASVATAIK